MTYRDLKAWADNLTEEELDIKLTPKTLLRAADPRLEEVLDEWLFKLVVIAPEPISSEAMRLIVLINVPY